MGQTLFIDSVISQVFDRGRAIMYRASFLFLKFLPKRSYAMTNIPSNLKYMKSDEWFDPASGKIGISDYAQNSLSDIVFVEILVEAGDDINVGKAIASVESVKASAEVYSPVNGKVIAFNEDLASAPETINSDPYGASWLIQVEGGDDSSMMSAAEYETYCEGRDH